MAFNVSPKYFASGIDNFGGVGVSSYINLTDNLQLIPEINTSFRTKSIANATLALRYSYAPGASVDFYCSNALGIQDIGQLLEGKGNRFGINFNIGAWKDWSTIWSINLIFFNFSCISYNFYSFYGKRSEKNINTIS